MTVITINGRKHKLPWVGHRYIGYHTVLLMAGKSNDRLYTVLYSHGHHGSSGTLIPDQLVRIADGMIFDITYTGNA